MGPQSFTGKRWLVQRIGVAKSGGNIFQSLLDGLSLRELVVLREHDDLMERASEIAKMSETTLLETIERDYDLEPQTWQTGEVWVGTEQIEDRIPSWFKSQHCGWYLSFSDGEFDVWARNFLMQEVRINIWIRYLEDQKKNPPKREHVYPGQYL